MRTDRIPKGSCQAGLTLVPRVGGVYLLAYSFLGDHACELTCVEQHPVAHGRFRATPCGRSAP